jgi:ABC-type dipeptide/oligopeptide/nickel transport system permease component
VPLPRPGGAPPTEDGSSLAGRIAGWIVPLAVIGGLLVLGLRYPFIGRRLLIMVPTLGVLSVLIFAVIQAPPGDFLTARLAELEENGSSNAMQQIDELRETFHFDEPAVKQYLRWSGLWWFTSFDAADRGLLQGDLGTSMQTGQPVGLIVGDRLLLTVLISAGTILFVWAVALPIGVYSAVYQYSAGDYLASLIGFVGMAVPNFLLALVLMALAGVSGLFSAEYAAQPEWTWGKVLDLLGHVWVPIVVLGTGGTAAMIRVMRANLLDELSKPYVTVARSKGVKPLKLLVKYPVRLAINPFVSGIGGLLPQLVSGGAIVAIVLSLPTVGPLLLEALFLQDMYLAGSLLMVLSLLGIVGTLLSDLLLMLVDPRIRMEGGSR